MPIWQASKFIYPYKETVHYFTRGRYAYRGQCTILTCDGYFWRGLVCHSKCVGILSYPYLRWTPYRLVVVNSKTPLWLYGKYKVFHTYFTEFQCLFSKYELYELAKEFVISITLFSWPFHFLLRSSYLFVLPFFI